MLSICVLFTTFGFVFAKWVDAKEVDKDNDWGICWIIGVFTVVFVLVTATESVIFVVYLAMRQTAVTDMETNAKKVAKLNSDRDYYKQAVDEWEAKVAKCKEKLRENMRILEKRESNEEEVIENWMHKLGEERRALAAQEDLQQADRQQKLAKAVKQHKQSKHH